MKSVYALLSEYPSASAIASAHLTRLTHLIYETSRGRYNKDTAVLFRETARISIGSYMLAKSLELKHTIKLIHELTAEIDKIKSEINSPILTIPGINYHIVAMIIAEIIDFRCFDSLDKILAYAGISAIWTKHLPHISLRKNGQRARTIMLPCHMPQKS